MNIHQSTLNSIRNFLIRCRETVYDDPASELLEHIRAGVWKRFMEYAKLPKGAKILDVGCGNGEALALMKDVGLDATGLTCSAKEYDNLSRIYPNRIVLSDMHDLPYSLQCQYDAVWARHSLEHSPIPLFVLERIFLILKEGGWLYVEVPNPDTKCMHAYNRNHFSVFSAHVWNELIRRAGFTIVDTFDINFTTKAGDDVYHGFTAKKS